jgi:hypothetical protein
MRLYTEEEKVINNLEKKLKEAEADLDKLKEERKSMYQSEQKLKKFGWLLAHELGVGGMPEGLNWIEAICQKLVLYNGTTFLAMKGARTNRFGDLAKRLGKPIQHSFRLTFQNLNSRVAEISYWDINGVKVEGLGFGSYPAIDKDDFVKALRNMVEDDIAAEQDRLDKEIWMTEQYLELNKPKLERLKSIQT